MDIARRDVLRYAAAGAVVTATGAAVQHLAVERSSAAPAPAPRGAVVEETYKGRHIAIAPAGGPRAAGALPRVLIDGAELHVMANADGTYTSIVTHYETHRTLRGAARAAVDELGSARLVHVHHR
jgi:hypothetical protein